MFYKGNYLSDAPFFTSEQLPSLGVIWIAVRVGAIRLFFAISDENDARF